MAQASCDTLPQPDDAVSLDAAWSPAGERIAFVRAPRERKNGGLAEGWISGRRLWLAAPDGSGAQDVAGGGVFGPVWDRAGRLLFVGDSALELGDTSAKPPVKVVSPFPAPDGDILVDGFYYGFFSTRSLFDWWSGS